QYLLTDPRQFDILQSGPSWRGANAIRSIETARVHHNARRRGGGLAACGTGAAAGQAANHRVLGLDHALVESQRVASFVQRLRELGWIDDRNVAIEYRWGEGRNERFAEIAAEFVRLKVDLVVASTTPAVIAAKQATSVIPIVFTLPSWSTRFCAERSRATFP